MSLRRPLRGPDCIASDVDQQFWAQPATSGRAQGAYLDAFAELQEILVRDALLLGGVEGQHARFNGAMDFVLPRGLVLAEHFGHEETLSW